MLGVAAARVSLAELVDFDEIIVLDPSTVELELLVEELAERLLDYLLGGLPVLPLPDASIDLLVGGDPGDPEVARVLRAGGRVLAAG